MTPTKLNQLKELINKTKQLEAAYISIVGAGRTQFIAVHSMFKWPDVVESLIAAAYENGDESRIVEDVGAMIIHTLRALVFGFCEILNLRPEEISTIGKTMPDVDKGDVDAILDWHKSSLKTAKRLAKSVGIPHLEMLS